MLVTALAWLPVTKAESLIFPMLPFTSGELGDVMTTLILEDTVTTIFWDTVLPVTSLAMAVMACVPTDMEEGVRLALNVFAVVAPPATLTLSTTMYMYAMVALSVAVAVTV